MLIKLCRKCVNPSTRPNVVFDKDGICLVCKFEGEKREEAIDWEARRRELDGIVQWGKENTKTSYDCIVTVSGGKDSTKQAVYARDVLGLKPLLVSCVYPPEQLHERGAYNLANLIAMGFDTVSVSLDPQVWKKMMRRSFFLHANWCRSTEMALYAIPIHVAIAYKIPLVFLGENPALTIGEKHGNLDGDASKMKHCNTLGGGGTDWLMSDEVSRKDLHYYNYPPDDDMAYAGLRIIYLGYYIEEWSGRNNAEFSIERGLKVRTEPPEKIGDLWGFSGLDEDFRLVNQMIKYIKFGFGHVTDQVCEAINLGMMDRKEGIELVKKYDGKCDTSYIRRFCEYLEITEEEFWRVVEAVRGKGIWSKEEGDEWRLNVDYT